MLGIIKKFQWS